METKNAVVKGSTEDVSERRNSCSSITTSSSYHSVSIDLSLQDPTTDKDTILTSRKNNLLQIKPLCLLGLWYVFSAGTLFSNKYLLSTLNVDSTVLGCTQILSTTICGFVQLKMCASHGRRSTTTNRHFLLSMLQLGLMRFMTVALGLIALKYVTVSFTETIKSSAPIFTVLISWLVLGERTPFLVSLSLIPIMIGLALTSAYDISFHIIGFLAALTNNVTDCVQNVYSKYLFSAAEFEVKPVELQFYTSVASALLQIPISLLIVDIPQTRQYLHSWISVYLLANGLVFHLQSFTAYCLMACISPVTHSVCNTVKRALLIWFSILLFNNPITFLSGLGMVLVSLGVLLYNQTRHYTESIRAKEQANATPRTLWPHDTM